MRHVGLTWNGDRKSTRLNSSHLGISYAVFCLKKKTMPVMPQFFTWTVTFSALSLTMVRYPSRFPNVLVFFFNDTATTEIYTLSLHDALPISTTTSERVSFRTLNRQTGNRVRRQFVDEQTGKPVAAEDQAKGYEIAKGEYVMLEDDELKSVQIESNHTIDIERFVPSADIDKLYLDTPYYLAPTDRVGEEAFAVIREAMRAEQVVGLARAVLFRRERVLKLEPWTKGIVATSLHFANEVHAADSYFAEIPDLALPKEMLELAQHI